MLHQHLLSFALDPTIVQSGRSLIVQSGRSLPVGSPAANPRPMAAGTRTLVHAVGPR
jgi:hypothetical protein